jgi:hypothetical protein
VETEIRALFAAYERSFGAALAAPKSADVAALCRAFAAYVVGSNPLGVYGGKNGLLYRLMLGRGIAKYRRIGMRRMVIVTLDVTPIDGQHALARVRWHSEYEKQGKPMSIDFDVTYALRVADDGPKIFAFVTGDEQKVLREHGLL